MGWLEITYFCKIRCFKRVSLAAEFTHYRVFFPFLGRRGGRQEGGAPPELEKLAQQRKVVVENMDLKEMTNHHLCKGRRDMALMRTEGREGRSRRRFIVFCMIL